MGYRVTHSEYLTGSLRISLARVQMLREKYLGELPEVCFLKDQEAFKSDGHTIKYFWWYGECSGDMDILLDCLRYTFGTADLLLVWEGGDSITGIRVEEGDAKEMKARIVLEPEDTP